MSERRADALEVLLPEAAPQFWQRAQRVTTFLRLLSDDAREHGGPSIAVTLARARGELERSSRARLVRCLEELLRHHLYALICADSFAHFGECEADLQSAWSELEEQRCEAAELPLLPAPGESAQSVALRLLAGLEGAGAGAALTELWRARLQQAGDGPRAALPLFEAWLTAFSRDLTAAGLRSAALAGVIECLLDRGAVRAARARFDAEGPRLHMDARLRRLSLWMRLLAGDELGPRALLEAPALARGRLPRGLAELRARVAAFAPALAGQPAKSAALRAWASPAIGGDLDASAAAARLEIGASLFSAWDLIGPGRARLLAHSVAPAHRGRLRAWLDGREGVCADPQEPEGQLIADAGARILHRNTPAGSLLSQSTIEPASTLSVACVAVVDSRGEVQGWLRLEFEHHLVPSLASLERLASVWSAAWPHRAAPNVATGNGRFEDERSSAAAVLRGFVEGLGLKTAQRRWSAFEVRDGVAELAAQAGGALEPDAGLAAAFTLAGPSRARGCESRAVARVLLTGRTVQFDDPDPRLALHSKAASGVAVPLRLGARVRGVWLVESTRRRDFSAADVQRFEARAQALAPELAAAQFRGWHRVRYGHDAWVTASSAGLGAQDLIALAEDGTPVALCGPLGSGRRMLARRMHFEGPARALALRRVQLQGAEFLRELEPHDAPHSLILERILDLPLALQARLAQWLEDRAAGLPRVFLLFDSALETASEQGRLAPELAWLLARIELRLEPLCSRRIEVAPLAQLFLAHFALEQGRRPPQLADDALAFLWRQAWPGNVRELAQWMYRLALSSPPERVDAACLEQLATCLGRVPLRRLPSRNPERAWISAALESTATRKGSWNKTRAALYLGWDPDTLQSRLGESALAENAAAEQAGEG